MESTDVEGGMRTEMVVVELVVPVRAVWMFSIPGLAPRAPAYRESGERRNAKTSISHAILHTTHLPSIHLPTYCTFLASY